MMLKGTKKFLNFMFVTFAMSGFWTVIRMDRIDYDYSFLIPTYLVLGYGFICWLSILKTDDRNFAEHQTDSVYFLGFVYTLMSLVGMFLKLKSELDISGAGEIVTVVFDYLAVAVTTSIGGVILRSLIRGSYLAGNPEPEENLEEACNLLKETAGNLSSSYEQTFEGIRLFLQERAESARLLSEKEREYTHSLDNLGSAVSNFTNDLKVANKEITDESCNFNKSLSFQSEALDGMKSQISELTSGIKAFKTGLEGFCLDEVTEDLGRFKRGTEELNIVIDSLVGILEEKVQRIEV